MSINKIDRFQGEYDWLSNFYPCDIRYGGNVYPTLEHAFQASKTENLEERKLIQRAETPGKAKRLGRRVTLREGWEEMKLGMMAAFVFQKFDRHPDLRLKLIETGDAELVEGNTWGDTFWGVDFAAGGHNHLGKILMRRREQLVAEDEADRAVREDPGNV